MCHLEIVLVQFGQVIVRPWGDSFVSTILVQCDSWTCLNVLDGTGQFVLDNILCVGFRSVVRVRCCRYLADGHAAMAKPRSMI